MKKKNVKKILVSLLLVVCIILVGVIGYVLYVIIDYSRIPDNQTLEVKNGGVDSAVALNTEYTILTNNIGFGAYTRDFTFFMDGGKQSWANSSESVLNCIDRAAETALSFEPDFVLLQEIDVDATRSYHIDQKSILEDKFTGYSSAFANNYHSAFLMYPFHQPHGASEAGIITFSKMNMTSSLRRSFPISQSLSKFLDLDRCYSVSRVRVEDGKELVIYNAHLSAYGGSDEIHSAQLNMLLQDMKAEYDKGNYVVCGGDFNDDFTGGSQLALNGRIDVDLNWAQPFPEELLPDGLSRCIDYDGELIPSCRNCDIPYEDGNFTIIVDGFIVSDNVEVVTLRNIDMGFEYSDHNPVVMKFILKG